MITEFKVSYNGFNSPRGSKNNGYLAEYQCGTTKTLVLAQNHFEILTKTLLWL